MNAPEILGKIYDVSPFWRNKPEQEAGWMVLLYSTKLRFSRFSLNMNREALFGGPIA